MKHKTFTDITWLDDGSEERVFEHCIFMRNQFSSAQLRGIKAYHCEFHECRFLHADLTEAHFDSCQFYQPKAETHCDFSYACLKRATFLDCDLSQAVFKKIEGYGMVIQSCKMAAAQFQQANFSNLFSPKVVLCDVTIIDSLCRFANFSNVALSQCTLTDNDFTEADFFRSQLNEANLQGCVLNHAHFHEASLENALIQNASIEGIDLQGCKIEGLRISMEQCPDFLATFGVLIDG